MICSPRYATPRTDRRSLGDRAARVAELLGTPLMPWQQQIVDVALEVDDDGVPAYREVFFTVPRQSGKSTLLLAAICDRAVSWGLPQRIAYTAQTGSDARKMLTQTWVPQVHRSKLDAAVRRVYRSAGAEAIEWKTDSRVECLPNTPDAGHGKTLDMAVLDEIFADTDDRREQAMIPAMTTRRDAQLWMTSTAGTAESAFMLRKVDQGRAAVLEGRSSGMCYFEWSADDDADPDDTEHWWAFMPALGRTITPSVVEHARATMSDGEFRRAYMNQWTDTSESVIPAAVWQAVQDADAAPCPPGWVFAVDVLPDRSAASIAVADESGAVELVDNRPGVGWVVGRVSELTERHGGLVVVDQGGPAGSLVDELEGCEPVPSGAVIAACSRFFDAVADRKVRVRPDGRLDASLAGAVKKHVGERWVWSRRGPVDASPLMAATLAYSAARGGADEAYAGPLVALR